MNWTTQQIAAVTGGTLIGGGDVKVEMISTDSRSLKKGDLFVALRGEHFDGHEFLGQAVRTGAAACLSEELVNGFDIPVIVVEDTLRALGDLAAECRRGFEGPVVAVTGTSGKTSTKDMVASILSTTGRGHKTSGNFNNLLGLPLTLFGLKREHRWLVLEMGMSRRGEIARLCEIAAPTVGLVTNVGEGHLEELGGVEGVARAKGELFAAIQAGGVAVVNCDDARVMQLPVANGVERLTFGMDLDSLDVRGKVIDDMASGCRMQITTPAGSVELTLNAPGQHQARNALAAAAVATALEVPLEKIAQGLELFRPPKGRMQPMKLRDDILLLDDTYNANPLSMRSALETLRTIEAGDGRFAVLGDMLELGESAAAFHRDIGRTAAGCVDALVTLGNYAEEGDAGAVAAGLAAEKVAGVKDHVEAVETLQPWLQSGARILVKGSRGMRMEKACELIVERLGQGGRY